MMLALSILGILSGIAGVVLSIRSGENLKQIKENVNITREKITSIKVRNLIFECHHKPHDFHATRFNFILQSSMVSARI